jgi:hypothetical protein
MIVIKNNKEYLKVSVNVWNNYLNKVSTYRITDRSIINCSLKNNKKSWCESCNSGIGNFTNSCVNIITSINLLRYEHLLFSKSKVSDYKEFYLIDIDRNDNNNNTI